MDFCAKAFAKCIDYAIAPLDLPRAAGAVLGVELIVGHSDDRQNDCSLQELGAARIKRG